MPRHIGRSLVANRRRGYTTIMAGAMALAALAGCGTSGVGGSSGNGNATSITELDYYTDQVGNAAWQHVLSSCSTSTGITIKRQSVPSTQMLQKVLQGASSHTLPNLMFIDNPTLQNIASTGALASLTDFGISTSGYYPSILKTGTYQGKVYGLAPGVNGLALFYNKTMLARAGLTPPTTWQQLRADAASLTSGKRYGLAFSAVNSEEGTWQFLPFFWSNGADLSKLDSPRAVAALQFLSGLVSAGSASRSVVNWDQNDVADQFVAGNAAMMINGSWNLPLLNSTKGLDYGVVPVPTPRAGQQPVVALGGEVGAISVAGTPAERASAKVLSCVLSEPNMLSWDKGHDYVPSKQSVARTFGAQNPQMSSFISEVTTARSRTAQLGTRYPTVSSALGTALQAALTGAKSPSSALSAAQQQASSGS